MSCPTAKPEKPVLPDVSTNEFLSLYAWLAAAYAHNMTAYASRCMQTHERDIYAANGERVDAFLKRFDWSPDGLSINDQLTHRISLAADDLQAWILAYAGFLDHVADNPSFVAEQKKVVEGMMKLAVDEGPQRLFERLMVVTLIDHLSIDGLDVEYVIAVTAKKFEVPEGQVSVPLALYPRLLFNLITFVSSFSERNK